MTTTVIRLKDWPERQNINECEVARAAVECAREFGSNPRASPGMACGILYYRRRKETAGNKAKYQEALEPG